MNFKPNFIWPGMKRVSNSQAKEYISNKSNKVYEILSNYTLKKIEMVDFNNNSSYFLIDEKIKCLNFLENDRNQIQSILFTNKKNQVSIKILNAYQLLIFFVDKLNGINNKKCKILISKIKYDLIDSQYPLNDYDNKGILLSDGCESLINLWDEIQIFFQEICPQDWYFIKKDECNYVFIFHNKI